MSTKIILLISAMTSFVGSGASASCGVEIEKTSVYMSADNSVVLPLCLNDYFQKRNMAFKSLGGDQSGATMFDDLEDIYFTDMYLFSLPNAPSAALGVSGRKALVMEILNEFLLSLNNGIGQCSLELFSGERPLSLANFVSHERTEEGQPGTRVTLSIHDVKNPNWRMSCPTLAGTPYIAKSGDYFYIFADVYENLGAPGLKGHFAKFLFSLN